MPEVGCRRVCTALIVLFLAAGVLAGRAHAWQIVEIRNFREDVDACRQGYDFPKVHTLPMGVGRAPVARCFSNGFTTIPPGPEPIGSCLIALEPKREQDQLDRLRPQRQPKAVKIIRRKYSCRFLGAGAVLGQSRGVRKTGTKVFFMGEEPTNFRTKDPNCESIFEELSEQDETYHHLIRR